MLNLEKIRTAREKLGLSQADAAVKAGMNTRQQWYAIESGAKSNIQMATLDGIAKALGVKPKDLLM